MIFPHASVSCASPTVWSIRHNALEERPRRPLKRVRLANSIRRVAKCRDGSPTLGEHCTDHMCGSLLLCFVVLTPKALAYALRQATRLPGCAGDIKADVLGGERFRCRASRRETPFINPPEAKASSTPYAWDLTRIERSTFEYVCAQLALPTTHSGT